MRPHVDLGLPFPVGAVPPPPLVLDCGCSFGDVYEACPEHEGQWA